MQTEKKERGIHNYKNLFRKPRLYELISLFIILSMFFVSWAYYRDITVLQNALKLCQSKCII